jgi:hypothetical protein
MKQDLPAAPVAKATVINAGRNRAAAAEFARAIQRGADSASDAGTSRDTQASPVRSGAPHDNARQTRSGMADRALADARTACQREGIAATRRELLTRIAKRVGLPQVEVARGLGGTIRRGGAAAMSAVTGVYYLHDPVLQLAAKILGVRERDVFLARRDTRPDDVAALHYLASCLGLSVERVYELEASARRKLDRALG